MLDIGFGEIVLIVIVVLIFFGPKSIPDVAATISKGMSKFKDVQNGFQSQMNDLKNEMNESIKQEELKKQSVNDKKEDSQNPTISNKEEK
ncbi:twin-arginine translocase TatA/TatE family subunit [Candidatus Kapabacteria bacterium]|nr:twin-arginine translocase TatA/TatE family subunit [Candidatus Kapabacteria bacterium]